MRGGRNAVELSDEEKRAIQAYGGPTVALIKDITAGMRRAGAMIGQRHERRQDPGWRDQFVNETRSWRRKLDAIPEEPPAVYAAAHARILRWAAAVAEAGDEYASAIERDDDALLLLASQKMAVTPGLYAEITRELAEVTARMRK
jgi:hypothetical protein